MPPVDGDLIRWARRTWPKENPLPSDFATLDAFALDAARRAGNQEVIDKLANIYDTTQLI